MPTPLSVPTFTDTERDAVSSPTAGMLIFNTSSGTMQYHNGSDWLDVGENVFSTANPPDVLGLVRWSETYGRFEQWDQNFGSWSWQPVYMPSSLQFISEESVNLSTDKIEINFESKFGSWPVNIQLDAYLGSQLSSAWEDVEIKINDDGTDANYHVQRNYVKNGSAVTSENNTKVVGQIPGSGIKSRVVLEMYSELSHSQLIVSFYGGPTGKTIVGQSILTYGNGEINSIKIQCASGLTSGSNSYLYQFFDGNTL